MWHFDLLPASATCPLNLGSIYSVLIAVYKNVVIRFLSKAGYDEGYVVELILILLLYNRSSIVLHVVANISHK